MPFRTLRKLGALALACALLGAAVSAIASAGAQTSAGSQAKHRRFAPRGIFARAVHGNVVVRSKAGFVTVTFDRGAVKSVSGQQLTLTEGTRTATYKTVTLTIPANAVVRDNRRKAPLADVKPGQRAMVVQTPKRTLVIARDARRG